MIRTIILLAFGLLVTLAPAQENLYDPVLSADSAFVRILQADAAASATQANVGDVVFGGLEYGGVSPYQVVPQGDYTASFGDAALTVTIEAGKFYSLAFTPTGVSALEDPVNGNMTKTMLVLYNLSDVASVDMKTADGSTAVVPGVAAGTQSSILVNPIAVDLAAFANDDAVDTFAGLNLQAGAVYSLVVMGGADDLSASWTASQVQR